MMIEIFSFKFSKSILDFDWDQANHIILMVLLVVDSELLLHMSPIDQRNKRRNKKAK